MKKNRYSEEQIIGFLKQAEAGMPVKELCRKGGFSDAIRIIRAESITFDIYLKLNIFLKMRRR